MSYGWAGYILRVDLSEGRITREPLNETWAREYIGGRGLGAKYLYEEMDPGVDALSPENDGYECVLRRPLYGGHQRAAHRGDYDVQFRWSLGTGVEIRRIRHGHCGRKSREALLSADQ